MPARIGRLPLGALLVSLCAASPVYAESSRSVRVLGSASLSATLSTAPSPAGDTVAIVRVEGRLSDDSGQGVGSAPVGLSLSPATPTQVKNCPGHRSLARSEGNSPQLETDAEGRFCFLVPSSALPGARLTFADPNGFLGDTALELPSNPSAITTQLSFVSPSPELSLDTPLHQIEVSASLPPAGPPPSGELAIELGVASPHGGVEVVASTFVRVGERARFEVPSTALGKPGAAVLVARLAADPQTEARQRVNKTAQVSLEAVESTLRARAGDSLEVPLRVRWQRGDVESGTVEARQGGHALAAATVEKGAARLVLQVPSPLETRAADQATSEQIELHFVPNAPWWQPGEPAKLTIELLPPSLWSKLPWAVAALSLFAWVALIWKRPARRARALTPVALEPPGREGLVVQDAAGTSLRGQVLDAHTSEPVAGAAVRVTEASLDQAPALATLSCDAEGRFEVALGDSPTPRQLHVSAPGYGEIVRPLPARGRIVVHLVTLRRSVLDQLTGWARRKGSPWSGAGSPTPGEVAATARARSESRVVHWAEDVEAAAYGPDEPTTATERALRDAEPP